MSRIMINIDGSHIRDKIVGDIIQDTYYTQRNINHFMFIYQGFGISKIILDILKEKNTKFVQIDYYGEKGLIRYRCLVQQFLDSEKKHIYHGTDLQFFVSVRDMEIIKKQSNSDNNTHNSTL